MNKLARDIHNWAHAQGFYLSPECSHKVCQHKSGGITSQIMLIVTELSEAVEGLRRADVPNYREEIADAMIRLLDLCEATNIDIEFEVEKKMAINRMPTRKQFKRF